MLNIEYKGVKYMCLTPIKNSLDVGNGLWIFKNKHNKDAVVINCNLNHILDKLSIGITPLTK